MHKKRSTQVYVLTQEPEVNSNSYFIDKNDMFLSIPKQQDMLFDKKWKNDDFMGCFFFDKS